MNTRQRRITNLALDYLACWWHEAADYLQVEYNHDDDPIGLQTDALELQVQHKIVFAPTDKEMEAILLPGKNGNSRTREILAIALTWLQVQLDDLEQDYYYQGSSDAIAEAETHLTLNGISFKRPTSEEIDDLLEQVDDLKNSLPPVQAHRGRSWDVYANTQEESEYQAHWELIDTVFFDQTCDRQYIKQSLVNHDGYDPNIILNPQPL